MDSEGGGIFDSWEKASQPSKYLNLELGLAD